MSASAERMAALSAQGLEIRHARTSVKAEVRAGANRLDCCERLAAVIEDQPAHLSTLMVWKTLTWARFLSDEQRRLFLHRAGIYDEFRTFEQLTDRQRGALIDALRSPEATRRNQC